MTPGKCIFLKKCCHLIVPRNIVAFTFALHCLQNQFVMMNGIAVCVTGVYERTKG